MEEYKLLVVYEGSIDPQELKKVFLESEFKLVGYTSSGTEGLKLLRKLKPDYVVTGLVLSNVDGFEVLKQTRETKTYCT